jgi:hypothetical protein
MEVGRDVVRKVARRGRKVLLAAVFVTGVELGAMKRIVRGPLDPRINAKIMEVYRIVQKRIVTVMQLGESESVANMGAGHGVLKPDVITVQLRNQVGVRNTEAVFGVMK